METNSPDSRSQHNLFEENLRILNSKLRRGEVTLFAGRPDMGTSSMAMHLALERGLRQSQPVYVFSSAWGLDNWATELAWRAADLNPVHRPWRIPDFQEKYALKNAALALKSAPITLWREIYMPPDCLPNYIPEVIPLALVDTLLCIDFLEWNGRAPHAHIDRLLSTLIDLKKMAQQLQVAVLIFSNLPRAVERREDKRPRLSDLPKAYLQAKVIDEVWLLYRHANYYKDHGFSPHHVEISCHNLESKEWTEFDFHIGGFVEESETAA
ncbi:MAG: DnaB-like helicase C-terminal domain-containing protein [Rhodoferax sp.]|nr:DnaB-like helicase C-terminal domain-containing protein [Rhodoferax sp.]